MPLRRHLPALALSLPIFVMLAWAWHLKDPRLFNLRDTEVPLLLALSAAVGALAWLLPRGVLRALALVGAGLTAMLTLWEEGSTQYRHHAVLSDPPPESRALSSHFVVGYRDTATMREWVAKGLVGGVFISKHNVQGKSVQAVRAEITEFQALRRATGLPPLVISTDQEGGAVSRLTPPLPHEENLAAVASTAASDTDLAEQAHDQGRRQGEALASLGVNINFSPVVDLKVDHGRNRLDFNSLISTRAISSDPARTTLAAKAYSLGLQAQGVLPTLKHFPGLGDVRSDTHYFTASLTTPTEILRRRDWLPFRDVATGTEALIMLGHVVVPEIDAGAPASMSRPLIQSVIRGEWQHDGVLITDDLTMAAAYDQGLCEAVPQALNAGVDLLLISYDQEKFLDAMYCAVQAQRRGLLDQGLMARSGRRLHALQARWLDGQPATAPPKAALSGRTSNGS